MTYDDFQDHHVSLDGRGERGAPLGLHVRTGGPEDAPPVVLLHGWPQHSLMWHAVAPALAERYRVVCPDLRGCGSSDITVGGYDKKTLAEDVAAALDALGIGGPLRVAGYDLGSGVAYALAAAHRDRVERLAVMEFGLAGFGYEEMMAPKPEWHLGSNWHLGFFTVPAAAEFAFRGRERELLQWFFWHIACDGSAVSTEHFERYVRQVSKPGALRAGFEIYGSVWQDADDNRAAAQTPLAMPLLCLGGSASSGGHLAQAWAPVATDVTERVVPHAGHWLGDENPAAVARTLTAFFDGDEIPDLA